MISNFFLSLKICLFSERIANKRKYHYSLKEASNELLCWFANKQIFILMKNKKNRTEIKCSVEGYPLLIPTEAAYFGKCLCL